MNRRQKRISPAGRIIENTVLKPGRFTQENLRRYTGRKRIGKTMVYAKILGYPLVFKFASNKHKDMRMVFDYTQWVFKAHKKIKAKTYELLQPPLLYAEKDVLIMAHAKLANLRDVLNPQIVTEQLKRAEKQLKKNVSDKTARSNYNEMKRRIMLANEFKQSYPNITMEMLEKAKQELITNMKKLERYSGTRLDKKLTNILIAGMREGKIQFIVIDQPFPWQSGEYKGIPEKARKLIQ